MPAQPSLCRKPDTALLPAASSWLPMLLLDPPNSSCCCRCAPAVSSLTCERSFQGYAMFSCAGAARAVNTRGSRSMKHAVQVCFETPCKYSPAIMADVKTRHMSPHNSQASSCQTACVADMVLTARAAMSASLASPCNLAPTSCCCGCGCGRRPSMMPRNCPMPPFKRSTNGRPCTQ